MNNKIIQNSLALIICCYLFSGLYGYKLHLDNPDGLMLYTQPAEPIENTMYGQPAFPIGMAFGLMVSEAIFGGLVLLLTVLFFLSKSIQKKQTIIRWLAISGITMASVLIGLVYLGT